MINFLFTVNLLMTFGCGLGTFLAGKEDAIWVSMASCFMSGMMVIYCVYKMMKGK